MERANTNRTLATDATRHHRNCSTRVGISNKATPFYTSCSLLALASVAMLLTNLTQCAISPVDSEVTTLPSNGHRSLPNALIIGARKGGTRALLEALAVQTDIVTARQELHFFDNDTNFEMGVDWYLSQIPSTSLESTPKIIIEKTPGYFTSKSAPLRVYETLRVNVKLLLIVRNPVTRTISDYSQVHINKLERNKPHMHLRDLAFDRRTGELALDYKPVRNSLYAKHIRHWLEYFPRENFLILNGDQFIEKPIDEVRRAVEFLGLDPSSVHPDQFQYNKTKGFYCFRRDLSDKLNCLGDTKGRRHVKVDYLTETRLRNAFRIYNDRFFDLMGVHFDW